MEIDMLRSKDFTSDGLPDWQIELIDKYPLIYREYDKSIEECLRETGEPYSQPYCNLRHGFEFLQGWRDLADEFSETTTKLVQCLRAGIQKDAYIHSFIFKEKFGTLRWQGRNNLMEPFRELFDLYKWDIEYRSRFICEITGKSGKLRRRMMGHRIQTLCDAEYRKLLREKRPE
jgi:hypothetical protein